MPVHSYFENGYEVAAIGEIIAIRYSKPTTQIQTNPENRPENNKLRQG